MSELKFPNRDAVDAALAEVRNANSDTDWASFTYEGNNTGAATIVLEAKGGGGLAALSAALQNDHISYALLRVIDVIDDHPTIKFVYITWIGPAVKFMQKAKITPHKGSATAFIGQAHVSLTAENLSEMTEEIVMNKVRDASGSNDRTLSGDGQRAAPAPSKPVEKPTFTTPKPVSAPKPASSPAAASPPPKPTTTSGGSSSSPRKFDAGQKKNDVVLPSSKDGINAVRSDSDPADWCLYGYEGTSNNLALVASGSGGVGELKDHLQDDRILYGLLRVIDYYDTTANTKFVYIVWVGERVPIMRKALITTHKGDVTGFIGQHHVALHWSNKSEASEEDVKAKVSSAAGTKNFVLDQTVDSSGGRIHLSGGL